jgi:hypothetical protein
VPPAPKRGCEQPACGLCRLLVPTKRDSSLRRVIAAIVRQGTGSLRLVTLEGVTMKFNLRVNPGWKVIDAMTGLEVTWVRWVDDETHDVAWCKCARAIAAQNNPTAALANAFGIDAPTLFQSCEDDKYVKAMPKVRIDSTRKIVLVNWNEEIKPEEEDNRIPAMRPTRIALLVVTP